MSENIKEYTFLNDEKLVLEIRSAFIEAIEELVTGADAYLYKVAEQYPDNLKNGEKVPYARFLEESLAKIGQDFRLPLADRLALRDLFFTPGWEQEKKKEW